MDGKTALERVVRRLLDEGLLVEQCSKDSRFPGAYRVGKPESVPGISLRNYLVYFPISSTHVSRDVIAADYKELQWREEDGSPGRLNVVVSDAPITYFYRDAEWWVLERSTPLAGRKQFRLSTLSEIEEALLRYYFGDVDPATLHHSAN